MNGLEIVLDTNIVLYILGGKLNPTDLPSGRIQISFITEIELLSYSGLTPKEEKTILDFIKSCTVIQMSDSIKNSAVSLRKKYLLKLPDAIIAATSIILNATLITKDKQLSSIKDLATYSPKLA